MLRDIRALGRSVPPEGSTENGDRTAAPGPGTTVLETLGDFEILRCIGRGGMGEVYLARQVSLDRIVALKVLPASLAADPVARNRFLREAKALARVSHPSVVTVYDVGVADGLPYIAMRYVEGASLQDVLAAGGRLEFQRALEIVLEIARALQAVHENGVLHRDIKPGNILLEGSAVRARKTGRAYLSDFGLAAIVGAAPQTQTGDVLGTPAYMSPQQAMGMKADRASDIYALGATLYALLSGRAPYEGSSHAEVLLRVAKEPPIPLRRLLPSVDREAALITEKAMRWDPSRRYRTAAEFADDIQRRLEGRRVLARPASLFYRAQVWARRNPVFVRLSGAFLALALAGAAAYAVASRARTFEEVRRALRRGELEKASGALESLVPFPTFLEGWREPLLRSETQLRAGELAAAARTLASVPRQRRALREEEIENAVERNIEDARYLRDAGLPRTALRGIHAAVSALEAIEATWSAGESRRAWIESLARAADDEARRILTDLRRRLEVARLIEDAANSPGGVPSLGTLREAMAEALGILEKAEGLHGENLDSMLDRLMEPEPILAVDLGVGGSPDAAERRKDHRAEDPLSAAAALFDRLLPRLQPAEASRLKARFAIRTRLYALGGPVALDAVEAQTSGDVDGDGLDEVIVATRKGEIVVLRCGEEGLRADERLRFDPREQAEHRILAVALKPLDLDEGPPGLLVFLFSPEKRLRRDPDPSYLRAFRLSGGAFAPFGERYPPRAEEPLDAGISATAGAIEAADVDGDGRIELIIGTGSEGADERSVFVVDEPFSPEARRTRLPDAGRPSDTHAVFAADFDGDGRVEIGATAGVWQGMDIRFWRYDARSRRYVGPLRIGPFGEFHAAVVFDLDSKGPAELLLAKSSGQTPNILLLPEYPHTGIPQGVYLFSLPKRAVEPGEILVRRADAEAIFSWSDKFPDSVDSLGGDNYYPLSLSAGAWGKGRRAFLASWRIKQRQVEARLVDLYLEESCRGSFVRVPLLEEPSGEIAIARFIHRRAGKGRAPFGIAILSGVAGSKVSAPWSARLLGLREGGPRPVSPLDDVEACLRTGKYDLAEKLARDALAERREGLEGCRLALGWAEAAWRNLRWEALDEALREAGTRLRALEGAPPLGSPEVVERLGMWFRRLEKLAEDVRRLRSQRPLEWPGPIEAGHAGSTNADTVIFDEPISVPPSDMLELKVEVTVRRVGFAQNIFVGLCPDRCVLTESTYGVYVAKTGGRGNLHAYISPTWGRIEPPPSSVLNHVEEGATYRATLLFDGARLCLETERIDAAGPPGRAPSAQPASGKTRADDASRRFLLWVPEFRVAGPIEDDRPPPGTEAKPLPLEEGTPWSLKIVGRGEVEPGEEILLTIQNIELRFLEREGR
ncbi:MAG: protein kinase domain-containing protein [Planctomycetota bacterium]